MALPTYKTAMPERATVQEGDEVYDYYSMERVVIGEPDGCPGWFETYTPGTTRRSNARSLNGERICTLAYAKGRGFPDA